VWRVGDDEARSGDRGRCPKEHVNGERDEIRVELHLDHELLSVVVGHRICSLPHENYRKRKSNEFREYF
jgi:hypothetical protein